MAKKISAVQRLVGFAMESTEEELNAVLEVVQAIKASRFPAQKKAARKTRSDKGTTRATIKPNGDSEVAMNQ